MQKAIIYCRVSSDKQVKEGHGLDGQELRCRKYAQDKGYSVVKVFPDEGISGGLFERPAMIKLIEYLDAHPREKYVIVFDDLSRFARDLTVHLKLRTEFNARGATLECLNFNFDESPEGIFIENVLASKAQLDREQNRRQVINRMKARIERGYWCFKSRPPGLIYQRDPFHGKILVREEPLASIYKEAIEAYKDGLLNTLEETQQFILKQYKKTSITRPLSLNGTKNILTELLYTGWIEYKRWDIPLQKAKHEGFISIDTYNAVQEKLKNKARVAFRKNYNLDFPLRGFVLCSICNKPMTASWHKGRTQRYPHYFCKSPTCFMRDKTVLKGKIEPDFEEKIVNLTPNKDVVSLAEAILDDIWDHRDKLEEDNKAKFIKEIGILDDQKSIFMRLIGKTTNEVMIKEYENEISGILKKKAEFESNLPVKIYSVNNFGTACDVVIPKIEKPVEMWQSPQYKDKRLLLEMYFDEKLPYDLKEGFGTVRLACLPKLLCIKPEEKNQLVEMPVLKPGPKKHF